MNVHRPSASLSSAALLALIVVAGCDKPQTQVVASQPAAESAPAPAPAPAPDPQQQFQEQLGPLGAVQNDQGWIVALPSARFESGQTSFEPADSTRIDGIAAMLKNYPDVHVLVQSFTDDRGSAARNQTLSQQRADAVQRALIERGVDAERIRSVGRGEAQPVAGNDTASGRERNRRVEIVFSDAGGRFAAADE